MNKAPIKILFTSESVSKGHPDKICDQISDGILDAVLALDKNAKVACETFITTNFLVIGGEVKSNKISLLNIQELAKTTAQKILKDLGYTNQDSGFDITKAEIKVLIHEQSQDIARGVELKNNEIGAGDQGIVFGYACSETKNQMPLAITLAHSLLMEADALRMSGLFQEAKSDMKAQVTIDKTNPFEPRIDTILMSIQHHSKIDEEQFKKTILEQIMIKVAKKYDLNTDFKSLINPTGHFVIGGPEGDTGLTGRKIIVDTYGGSGCHGGGAFSGKDPTKVDRSGAYFARYIAKNVVAAGLASVCEIQLSYAIGVPKPLSVFVNTHNTIRKDMTETQLTEVIIDIFNFSIKDMIEHLKLKEQKYFPLAVYGHFGRDELALSWEQTDMVEKLQEAVQNMKK